MTSPYTAVNEVRTTRDLRDPAVLASWRAEYHPCETGVSIFQPEGGEFGGLTLKNYPDADVEVFRRLSSAGDGDDFDLLADVYRDGDLIDTIAIRRQDLEPIDRAIASAESSS